MHYRTFVQKMVDQPGGICAAWRVLLIIGGTLVGSQQDTLLSIKLTCGKTMLQYSCSLFQEAPEAGS